MITHKLQAIIFDVDGTLVHSEREGHWPACNDAFQQLGLPLHWDWETFKELLHIPGNANRLKYWLTSHLGWDEQQATEMVARFEPIKKKIYIEHYLPNLSLRKGVIPLLDEAINAQIPLAIVSTTYESQIHALLERQLKPYRAFFQIILGKESGPKTGENGMLYEKCVQLLSVPPSHILVIEDSQAGLQAALKAGLPVAVFYNEVTWGENFTGARLVARSLAPFNLKMLEELCL